MRSRCSIGVSLLLVGWLGCTAPSPDIEESKYAVGTGLFAPYAALDVGSYPSATAVADINGDGLNEVLMTTGFYFDDANDYKLMLFRPGANGAMQEVARYPIGRRAESMSIGDVNGDGRDDVVVGNFDDYTIGILHQNAAGTLDPMVTIATQRSYRVRVADLNSDGRKDIVGINTGARLDGLELYLQDGNGQLVGPVVYPVAHGGWDDLEVGDVNSDGRTDIVVMSGQGTLSNLGILLQTAEGTFAAPVYYSVGPITADTLTHGVAIGDVNGDGRQDVIVSYGGNRPASKIGVFIQNDAGGLNPAQSLASYDIPEPVVVADVDRNGATDVLVLHGGWNAMGVYSQTTAGLLDAEVRYPIPYASHYSTDGIAIGDFTDDGLPDVAIADYNYGLVTLKHLPMPADTTPPVVTVDAPTGTTAYVGTPLLITWTASDDVGVSGFDVLFSADGGATTTPIAECTGLGPAIRGCTWASPGPASPTALVRVVARDASGNSASADGAFVLVPPPDTQPPTVAVGEPTGRTVTVGVPLSITWTASDNVALGGFDVLFSADGGATTTAIADCTGLGAEARACTWSSPGPASTTALVRVVARDSSGNTASADGAFVLVPPPDTQPPTVAVGEPTGLVAYLGLPLEITWTASDNVALGGFDVLFSADGGATMTTIAECAGLGADARGCTWASPGPASATAVIRVVARDSSGNTAFADGAFTLAEATLAVARPARWLVDTQQTITWTQNLPGGDNMLIELSRDGGASWQTIAAAAPNTGSYTTTVTGPPASDARLRVTWLANPTVQATTTPGFAIEQGAVAVTAPNTRVTLRLNHFTAITWTHNLGAGATFNVDVSRDGGGSWTALARGVAAASATTGSYNWFVTAPKTSYGRIRVTWTAVSSVADTSNVNFIIK